MLIQWRGFTSGVTAHIGRFLPRLGPFVQRERPFFWSLADRACSRRPVRDAVAREPRQSRLRLGL